MKSQKENNVINIKGEEYVLITKKELEEYKKAKNNLEYIEELNRRFEAIKEGKVTQHNLIEVN